MTFVRPAYQVTVVDFLFKGLWSETLVSINWVLKQAVCNDGIYDCLFCQLQKMMMQWDFGLFTNCVKCKGAIQKLC